MLVKCPKCGEIKRVYHDQFRHCGVQYRSSSHRADNPSPEVNPSEPDPIKEAVAKRVEKGELSGSGDVLVKGVPVHFEFMSKGAPYNPCPPDNPELEGKIKVFNSPKPTNPKIEEKTESKIEKVVEQKGELMEGGGPIVSDNPDSELCPRCHNQLVTIRKVSWFGLFESNGPYLYCPECYRFFTPD